MNSKIPHNPEAEKAVLGSMIENENSRIEAISTLSVDDFYGEKSANRDIFRATVNLNNKGKVVDITTLTDELLNHMHTLDEDGGTDYLLELQESYVGEKHALYHINIVRDLGLLRRLLAELKRIDQDYNTKEIESIPDFVANAEKRILDITKARRVGGFKNSGEIAEKIALKLESDHRSGKEISAVTGLDTGYPNLNQLTLGFQPGSLCILAARPSVGKTTFAINLACNVAIKSHKTVAIFSLEMSAEDIVKKMISSQAVIVNTYLATGQLSDDDWVALYEAKEQLKKARILIDDTSGAKLFDIRAKAQKLKREDENLGLIVIDYMGLITTNNTRIDNRQLEVSEISRSLKSLARELNVPILCLCQLSRASEKRTDRRPVLSDLRDSGSIEQDADQVMFIYRPKYQDYNYKNENQDSNPNGEESKPKLKDENTTIKPFQDGEETQIILSKNRTGEVGTVYYTFFPYIGKFAPVVNIKENEYKVRKSENQ